MKITVIHGSPRRQNTYETAQRCLEYIRQEHPLEVQEFFLPQDLPDFCRGCLLCVTKGEQYCPHHEGMQPIVDAICASDGVIFTSPVYVMSVSGAMKNFLDHGAYLFLNHRTRPELFAEKALVLSTAAGAGVRHTNSHLKRVLVYWGFNRVHTHGIVMRSAVWEDMPGKRRESVERRLKSSSLRFAADVGSKRMHRPYLLQRIMFSISKRLVKIYPEDNPDRRYWEDHGLTKRHWFVKSGQRP